MKKIFTTLVLAVGLSFVFTAILVHAADQTPGSDVKSVQPIGGRDSGGKARAIQVGADGSVVISGTVGGSTNLQTAAKGATATGSITSTAASADRQPMDVTIRDTSGAPVTSFGATNLTTATKGATASGNPTSTAASSARQPLDVTAYDTSGVALGTTTNPTVSVIRTGFVKTGAPSFSVSISASSAAATGLTSGACYRVACSATAYFRSGPGTPTAVTTDNPFFGPSVEKICIPSTDSALAFVTSTGTGTCAGTVYAVTP